MIRYDYLFIYDREVLMRKQLKYNNFITYTFRLVKPRAGRSSSLCCPAHLRRSHGQRR